MIHDQLKEDLKTAMKARDEIQVRTIRSLLAALVNELVATKRKPDKILPDDDALKVIKRAANQRKDSIEQFSKGCQNKSHIMKLRLLLKKRLKI